MSKKEKKKPFLIFSLEGKGAAVEESGMGKEARVRRGRKRKA